MAAETKPPAKPPFQEYYIDPNGVLTRIDSDGHFHEVPLDPVPLHGVRPGDAPDDADDEVG